MPTPTEATFPPTDWRAENLTSLREIWKDLQLDSEEETTRRRFRGHTLTPEQAGGVFERWVLEAFRLSGMAGHHAYQVPLRESGKTREQSMV